MSDKKQKIQIEGHKLMYHVDEVSRWLKGDVVAPIYVEFGLINSCNHNCVFCALDYLKSKGSAINKDVLINNLKDMAEFGVKSVMFAGEGEPLMYPHISEAIEKNDPIPATGVYFDQNKKVIVHLNSAEKPLDLIRGNSALLQYDYQALISNGP